MRILVVSPFPAAAARGNSVAAARLARGFAARGHRVFRVGGDADPGRLAAARPEVALVMHAFHGARAAASLRVLGIPYVVSLRGTDANEMLAEPARSALLARTLAGAALVTVFNREMGWRVTDRLPTVARRLRLVPNGLELPVSRLDYRALLGIAPRARVFISLAGLREVKQPLFPLAWLARLGAGRPAPLFLHAGPEIEPGVAAAFRRLAAGKPWAISAGEIPHETVDSFLRAGDVFVSASRSEGMPHAVREAMLAGLPPLLSDIPGHRALARPGREAVFFRDGPSFLAGAGLLLDFPELRRRLGAAARARVTGELDAADEINRYLSLLKEVAA